jgi:very-short-patch-repair endonuclease
VIMLAQAAPSSALRAPSPRGGEGRVRVALSAISTERPASRDRVWQRGSHGNPFSPAGRRCRQADEGAPRTDRHDVTKRHPGKTTHARQLRQTETEAEYYLWSDLRARRLNGFKFARQIPLGAYVVDFLCREKGLVVELDGTQHAESFHDIIRTRWLNAQGYGVIRFWNHEVFLERAAVLETILAVLDGRLTEACDTIRFSPAVRRAR